MRSLRGELSSEAALSVVEDGECGLRGIGGQVIGRQRPGRLRIKERNHSRARGERVLDGPLLPRRVLLFYNKLYLITLELARLFRMSVPSSRAFPCHSGSSPSMSTTSTLSPAPSSTHTTRRPARPFTDTVAPPHRHPPSARQPPIASALAPTYTNEMKCPRQLAGDPRLLTPGLVDPYLSMSQSS